jgi:ParB-like nuclease domain
MTRNGYSNGESIFWPADHVERRDIDSLVPYARNARQHSEAQIAQVAASMQEWGWTMPVLISEENELIAGHCRVLAAHKLGLHSVPVMIARRWTETQIQAYRLADNKLTLNSAWDLDLLRAEVLELQKVDFTFDLAGFTPMEIDQLFAADSTVQAEWQGMPEYTEGAATAFRSIVVHFDNQADLMEFFELIGQPLLPVLEDATRPRPNGHRIDGTIWYPKRERQRKTEEYVSDESTISDLHPV